MSLDHAEFIARHHKTSQADLDKYRNARRGLVFSGVLIVLYLSLCMILAWILNIGPLTMMGAGFAFVMAAGMAFWALQRLGLYKDRERERRLIAEVLEGSRGARLITDGADNTVYTNQKFDQICRMTGSGTGVESLTRLFEDNTEALNHFRTLADQAHRGLTESIELKTGEGEKESWYLVTAQPIAGWAGYVHWRVDDITQQREIDRSIREEREKLIDFTDNAPVGFFSVDEEGNFVFVNATLARWLGEDIQDLLSRGKLHTYLMEPPKDAAPYDIKSRGGARQIAEVVMKGPGGKTFMASVNQAVVKDFEGRIRTRGVVHDLTSEREMRQALQASEDRFQRFFEEAPLGIALIDPEGKISDCNVALAAMLGMDGKAVEGRAFQDLLAPDNRESVLAAMDRIGQGQQMQAPIEITLQGRKTAIVQAHARKFKGSDNTVLHFIDLTQQKELEARFVQSQKMQAIGQLAGGVAHDFNNLLTAMIGFCDLLLLRHKPGDSSFADIMQIKQNANRAANLVRQLLAFSRQQTLRPRVQDVTDILTEVSHLIRRLIGANIELRLVHGQSLGLIKVDVGQMEQVLINLAVNARDAMENGGQLTIRTKNFESAKPIACGDDTMPPGAWVMIEVSDTGCGMPLEILSRIFEPFFTTKDVGRGTGLGLATVYGIIRQTGGYLHVESNVGQGTSFFLYLPRLSEAEAQASIKGEKKEEEVAQDLTGTARILLVEDEDAVRTFSTRALVNKGYEVLDAASGESALDVMKKSTGKPIDLLITDVMMPNMDGPTLAKKIREEMPNLKIIFISGYTEDKLKDNMGRNIFFLPKPFTLKQLAAKVKEVLTD